MCILCPQIKLECTVAVTRLKRAVPIADLQTIVVSVSRILRCDLFDLGLKQ